MPHKYNGDTTAVQKQPGQEAITDYKDDIQLAWLEPVTDEEFNSVE
ncbi:MAG: hypothetical protein ABI813_10350 [Bacteroidota bacterium]